MEENLSDYGQIPGKRLFRLYERWANGGVGTLITGNVMIAPDALTGPGGIVLETGTNLDPFKRWASAATAKGAQCWMQINHPGRQVYADMGEPAVSASDVPVDMGRYSNLFAKPRALSADEINLLIERFATTAFLAEQSGFAGVQIHAAHGYLISQFLSPLTNKRTDDWGGGLEQRARFLFSVIEAVRSAVSPRFCLTVKLNSADFQKGGFDESDARWVIERLGAMSVDLVELSGGSYESPAMQGRVEDGSSAKREVYFVEFARDASQVAPMPIMVTGGIRRLSVAREAIEKDAGGFGISLLGIGRALAYEPDLPIKWLQDKAPEVHIPVVTWKNQAMAGLATMALTKAQLERLAIGKAPKANMSPILALLGDRMRTRKRTKRYRKWRKLSAK